MDKVIVANGLSLSYTDENKIIDNASFSIDAGSFVFITGASGSGKSTLLKSFFGAIKPMNGGLFVGGVDLSNISSKKLNHLRRHIGIIFQDYKLIKEWTIEKNIGLPLIVAGYEKDVTKKQVDSLLNHVKLKELVGKYPLEISGGEQQRVAMARALAHNPLVVLADEPTGNLDDYSSELIWNLLVGTNEQLNTTVIVVTHKIPININVDYRHFHIEYRGINEVH